MNSSKVLNSSASLQNVSPGKISAADKMPPPGQFILVLAKDDDTRFLYKSFLEIWNYHVAEAVGIEEIFAIAEHFQPQLILMDCSQKFENNIETIRKIRGNTFLHKTPLILVSGYSQQSFRDLALENGADDFLVKPLNFDDLRINLEKYVEPAAQDENWGERL